MISKIIQELRDTPGTNDKLAILESNKENELLKEYIYLTLSPRVRYFIKSNTIPEVQGRNVVLTIQDSIDALEKVKNRELTGNAARDYIYSILSSVSEENEELLRNMFDSDLRCGVNHSSVNKIWKDLIKYPEVLLASTDLETIHYPAYSQLKADGVRVLYEDGIFQTRNGNILEVHNAFDELHKLNVRLDGEFVCYKDGKPLDRKTSNGIINKAGKGTISPEEADLIVYQVWDFIRKDVKAFYSERFDELETFLEENKLPNLILIESKIVNNYDEALEHFKDCRRAGHEGTILKNTNSLFENKRSKNIVKMKAEYEADLLVTGFEYGTGKNKDRIGNLLLESACGNVKVSCGVFKDFPEEIRDDWLPENQGLPKIVTVRYNERITAKGRETESLFLPRVISVRTDKNEADDLDKMIKEEEAVPL